MTITKFAIITAITAAASILTGCSTAGPFVTSISSDGRGGLIIEKNTVHFNWITQVISTGDHPTSCNIKVAQDDHK